MTIDAEVLGRTVHEAVRALCQASGDNSLPPWSEATQEQRNSTFAMIDFTIANPDAPPSAQHDRWMDERKAQGWTWGPRKDPEARTNPALVPYEELPVIQRAKDHVIQAIVLALT